MNFENFKLVECDIDRVAFEYRHLSFWGDVDNGFKVVWEGFEPTPYQIEQMQQLIDMEVKEPYDEDDYPERNEWLTNNHIYG